MGGDGDGICSENETGQGKGGEVFGMRESSGNGISYGFGTKNEGNFLLLHSVLREEISGYGWLA
jgi:hypothetical protein